MILNYKLIIYLSTTDKFIRYVLTNRIYTFLEEKNSSLEKDWVPERILCLQKSTIDKENDPGKLQEKQQQSQHIRYSLW